LSSILRALKKLENDPRHLEEPRTLESKFVPLADTRQHKRSTGLLIMILGAGITCGLVVLAGWWLLSDKKMQTPIATQLMSRKNLQQPEANTVMPEKSFSQQESEPADGSDIPLEPEKPSADIIVSGESADLIPEPPVITLPKPSSRAITQKTVLPIAEQEIMVSSSPITEIQNSETIEPVAAEEVTAAETKAPEPSLFKAEEVEIPVLKDPEMKLQAITWSKDPRKRIAVINNSILRQGEAVSGYRIDAINQDDVVLNDRGKKWKILFRIR
jgi:hypothetical protein